MLLIIWVSIPLYYHGFIIFKYVCIALKFDNSEDIDKKMYSVFLTNKDNNKITELRTI